VKWHVAVAAAMTSALPALANDVPVPLLEQMAKDDRGVAECMSGNTSVDVMRDHVFDSFALELNGNLSPEFVVSAGCNNGLEGCCFPGRRARTWVYGGSGDSYRLLLDAGIPDEVLRLGTFTNGYLDLAVVTPGGYTYSASAERYEFDGSRYVPAGQLDDLALDLARRGCFPAAIASASSRMWPAVSPREPCGDSPDPGFTLWQDGHLFSVRRLRSNQSSTVPPYVFLDETGTMVTNGGPLLEKLLTATWTIDHVVNNPDVHSAELRLSGRLGDMKQIVRYEAVQDYVVRLDIEALKAGLTGGASLPLVPAKAFAGAVTAQLANVGGALTTYAQIGLQDSREAYARLELFLPPQSCTVYDVDWLKVVSDQYVLARGLELPATALVRALMPTSGVDLFDQGLSSAVRQTVSGGLPQASETAMITAREVLAVQTLMLEPLKPSSPLRAYAESLALAISLPQAERDLIVRWTNETPTACLIVPTPLQASADVRDTMEGTASGTPVPSSTTPTTPLLTPPNTVSNDLLGKVRTLVVATYQESPLANIQLLQFMISESERAGVPPWLIFGQARFETTFADSRNVTTGDGVTFTDGSTGNAHNLFNIRPGSSWTGKVLDSGRGGLFRVYDSYESCVRDYLRLVVSPTYRGKTLEEFINTYYPASENGQTAVDGYIQSVIDLAARLGFDVSKTTKPV
jgi:hypothetical protein